MNSSIEYIQSLDLQYLVNRIVKQYDWDLHDAKEVVRKYKNFLILLLLHPECNFVPTRAIDVVWHEHILHTQEYMKDCRQAFGKYIHHHPNEHIKTKTEKERSASNFIMTARLYERHFQEPYGRTFDITIWF